MRAQPIAPRLAALVFALLDGIEVMDRDAIATTAQMIEHDVWQERPVHSFPMRSVRELRTIEPVSVARAFAFPKPATEIINRNVPGVGNAHLAIAHRFLGTPYG